MTTLVLFLPFLGAFHLFDWDEVNFAECAREMIETGESVLDFGCGRGGFLLSAKKAGFEVCGVESITTTYNELEVKNIKVYNKLESLSSPVNVITFWHSLEHINDVNQTLMLCRKFLKEKGILIVAVPNHDSFDAKHYKSFWAAYDVPRHRFHFNKKGLIKTVQNLCLLFEFRIPVISILCL